ncbi:MAG: cysteine desulfurase family protein [bacterium]|nr:cysteine desulfurase family protein [bacterium]
MKRIYLDNAATTKVDPQVKEAMLPFLAENFGNPSSIHSVGQEAKKAVDLARQTLADLLGCTPREVIFTGSATEANNLALKGVLESFHRCTVCGVDCPEKGKTPHLIVSQFEHHAVLDTAKHLEKMGYDATFLPVDKDGLISVGDLEKSIRENTALISIMYVNNEVGTIEPISEIGKMLKEINRERQKAGRKRIFFHTDAVQAIQYLDCNVEKLGADLLSLTAHKFYGPKGVGALYIKRGTPIVRQMDGGGQEYYLRAGTENVAGIAGMGKAIQQIANGNWQMAKIQKLRDRLIKGVLNGVSRSQLTGHPQKRAPHIASFIVDGAEGESILLMLDEKGVASSSGSACTSGQLEPSHVLTAMGVPPEKAHGSIRFSLGKENTEEEIDYVIKILPGIVEKLRIMSPIK